MDIFDQITGLDLWKWALETAPADYLVYFAGAILVGIAFKFMKEPISFIVELIARFGNFIWYMITHLSSKVREEERREMRKDMKA